MIYMVLAGRECEHRLNKDLCFFLLEKIVAPHSEKGREHSAYHVAENISTVSQCFSHNTIMMFAVSQLLCFSLFQ